MAKRSPTEIGKLYYVSRMGKIPEKEAEKFSSELLGHLMTKIDELGDDFLNQKEEIISTWVEPIKEKKVKIKTTKNEKDQ